MRSKRLLVCFVFFFSSTSRIPGGRQEVHPPVIVRFFFLFASFLRGLFSSASDVLPACLLNPLAQPPTLPQTTPEGNIYFLCLIYPVKSCLSALLAEKNGTAARPFPPPFLHSPKRKGDFPELNSQAFSLLFVLLLSPGWR